jgi:DUF438 domain-containing protein
MMNIRTINSALTPLANKRTIQDKLLKQMVRQAKYSAMVENRYHQLRVLSSEAKALVAKSSSLSVRTERLRKTIEGSSGNPIAKGFRKTELEDSQRVDEIGDAHNPNPLDL